MPLSQILPEILPKLLQRSFFSKDATRQLIIWQIFLQTFGISCLLILSLHYEKSFSSQVFMILSGLFLVIILNIISLQLRQNIRSFRTAYPLADDSKDHQDWQALEITLQESEYRLKSVLENTSAFIAGVYLYDMSTWEYQYCSPNAEDIYGYTSAQIASSPSLIPSLILPEDLQSKVIPVIEQMMVPGFSTTIEYRIRRRDGQIRWLSNSISSSWDDRAQCVYATGITLDITDLRQTEIELQASQQKLQAAYAEQQILLGAMTDVVLVRKRDGQCIRIAETQGLNLKGTRDEVLRKTIYEELPLEVANTILASIELALTSKKLSSCDYYLEINGRHLWFASNFLPLTEDTVIQVSRDITERKQSEIAIANARDAAEQANKAKSEFLANMSHEIRTPMNGVLGMAQLLATTDLNDEQQEFVQTILDSGDVLLAIINDILDFSKIEAGMLELEQSQFHLTSILQSVYKLLKGQADAKQIDLVYLPENNLPELVIGDSTRLRQIVFNLVSNAIKFTSKGQVSIVVQGQPIDPHSSQYRLRFAIADSGIGIPSDRIEYLFQAFTQADSSINRRYGGTGLGLAISKRLVELMNGNIWVESFGHIGGTPPQNWQLQNPTHGSTFYFDILLELP
ncbi:MAG: ATP-binding protein [Pseudanabaenaceae cyanobacterium bins.39]|nr:ATP-binding protein [Pseudanabaenaceae cyanobacterium bins.39]